HLPDLFGMGLQPGADGLHRDLRGAEGAAVDQLAADGGVGMAVLRRVAEPQLAALGEADAPGALDVEEKGVDRIVHPDHLELAAGEASGIDLLSVGERNEVAVHHLAGDPPTFELLAEAAEVHHDQLGRSGVDRHRVLPRALAAAVEEGQYTVPIYT